MKRALGTPQEQGAATVHRATINRATVNRQQFTGRHLTGATINRSDNYRVPLNRATPHRAGSCAGAWRRLREGCCERFQWSVSRRDRDGLLFSPVSECHTQSERDVEEAFELLSETQPTTVDHMDELTSFLEHTYIRGRRRRGRAVTYSPAVFPVETWNQHAAGSDGIVRLRTCPMHRHLLVYFDIY